MRTRKKKKRARERTDTYRVVEIGLARSGMRTIIIIMMERFSGLSTTLIATAIISLVKIVSVR